MSDVRYCGATAALLRRAAQRLRRSPWQNPFSSTSTFQGANTIKNESIGGKGRLARQVGPASSTPPRRQLVTSVQGTRVQCRGPEYRGRASRTGGQESRTRDERPVHGTRVRDGLHLPCYLLLPLSLLPLGRTWRPFHWHLPGARAAPLPVPPGRSTGAATAASQRAFH